MPRPVIAFTLAAAMAVAALTRAAQPAVLWATPFDHTLGTETVHDLTVDGDGNPIAIGSDRGSGFVCKFSPTGEMLWKTDLGSIYETGRYGHHAKAIAVDGEGNIYATGETANSKNKIMLFLYKLSPDGRALSTFHPDNGRWSSCHDITAAGDGFIVGGRAEGGFHSRKARKTTATLLARVDTDLSFGKNVDTDRGKTKIHGYARHLESATRTVRGLAVLPDGRVAVIGEVEVTGDRHTYLHGKNLRRIE